MRDKLDILALVFGFLGVICLAYSMLVPRWYVGGSSGIGPWMHCHWGAKGLQCGMHGGILIGMFILLWIALSALLISGFAMCGTNCCGTNCCGTKCCGDNAQKKLFAAGCLYLISCLATLGLVMWATVILGPMPSVIGECVYLAWVSVGLLMTAVVLQLHRYSPCRRKEEVTQNCTSHLEHEDEEERYGEESVHFLKSETIWERGKQEMVSLKKYGRTGDSVTEPAGEDSKRQYV